MTDDLAFLDAIAQAELVRRGDVSPIELVDAAIGRVEKLNPELNAVIHPRFDAARAEAGSVPDGPLRGVPIVIKDLDASSRGDPLHQGNRALRAAGNVADHDSWHVDRFRRAGCVIIGKTNTPEFGLMPTTEPEAYGPTRNPWNTEHGVGGSSGGSAAAVASGMVAAGHAGDGGGSIRIPASACGLFGLKPTRARISMGPDLGEAWAGMVVRHAVTRSVRDSAALLDVTAGPMPGDPYYAPPPARRFGDEVGADPGRLRIGLRTIAPGELVATDPDCEAAARDAAEVLASLGHEVVEASPAALNDEALMANFTIVLTTGVVHDVREVARTIGRDLTADDVEPLTWAFYEAGRPNTAVQYLESVNALHAWSRRVAAWWTPVDDREAGFDLLLTPTMAEPPPVIGDVVGTKDDPWHGMARASAFAAYTAPFNVSGQPAMSVPLAWEASRNLPIGVQLVAAYAREDLLLRVASQLEAARPWADRRPVVRA
ncbi:MAG TPA: amidase [Acidimicrobiia bacterium]|nr:amidase [Acidimicrobiia bacterium]